MVRLPVGTHEALMVPVTALTTTAGLDYISANNAMRVVVPGSHEVIGGVEMVEILSGLQAGDVIETDGAKHE